MPTAYVDMAPGFNVMVGNCSGYLTTRLLFRKIAKAFDTQATELVLKDRKIASLEAEVARVRPKKRKKV